MNELQVIERSGQRVLLTNQLADSYGTDTKTITRNFQRNSNRYIEGKHYYALTGEALREFKGSRQFDDSLKFTSVLYLWTEKGAFLHAKSLNTDQAWEVYDRLVESYFVKQPRALTEHEQRIELLKLSLEHEQKFNEVDQRIEKLEENIRIDAFQQTVLQKQIGIRVYKVFEEYNPDSLELKKLFPKIHRNLRDAFGVPTYKDIRKIDFDEVISWVKSWRPLI